MQTLKSGPSHGFTRGELTRMSVFDSTLGSHLPLASGWTKHRDFPAPQGLTFQSQWKWGRRR